MKITNLAINNLFFKSNIIDAHTHVATDENIVSNFNQKVRKETTFPSISSSLLKAYYLAPETTLEKFNQDFEGENKVLAFCVSNLDSMSHDKNNNFLLDETSGNLKMYQIYKDNLFDFNNSNSKSSNKPKAILYATCQVGTGNVNNIKEVFKQTQGAFRGLKFHPQELFSKDGKQGLRATNSAYIPYLEFAQKYNLPCLYHTQVNVDYSNNKVVEQRQNWEPSDPRLIYEEAKKFPKVPIILGHVGAGGPLAHNVAINVLESSLKNQDANLYAEISWMDFQNDYPNQNPESIIKLLKMLKKYNALDKVMFGTDCPIGVYEKDYSSQAYQDFIENIKKAVENDEELAPQKDEIINKLFYQNAINLFSNTKYEV